MPEPTFAEYLAWRRDFLERMDRVKESQMNARQVLNELQDVVTGGKGLDELMVLATQAQAMRATYEGKSVPVPEWLDDANRTLNARIAELNREILEARLREVNQSEAALKTPTEKRADLAKERERLEQLLGRKSADVAGDPVSA